MERFKYNKSLLKYMEKFVFFSLIVILLFFISGCSEKIELNGTNEKVETINEESIIGEINNESSLEENQKEESDLVQNESLINEENQSVIEKKDINVWMAKTPYQCGDISVPNSIYFDYSSTIFPDNDGLPDFPIIFNWRKNAIEFYKAEAFYYEKNDEEATKEASDRVDELVKLYYSLNLTLQHFDEDIVILDAKKIHREGGVCAACSCPTLYTVYLLIDEKDMDVLLELGYGQTEEPKILE